jgi:tetratricopeptide (TPR) repeat protein
MSELPADQPQDVLAKRAALRLQSDVELALDDLEALARQRPHPALRHVRFIEAAVEDILERNPAQVRALKLRAYLRHHMSAPEEALKDLDRAIELAPDDADAHYWRALANLSSYHGGRPREIFFGTRIGRAVLDLSQAVRLTRGGDLAVEALKWVVDHTSAHPRFLSWWTTLIGEDVLPGLRPVLKEVSSALASSEAGDWQAAADRLLAAWDRLESLGLPVFANSLNLHVADAYIGLYQIPKALDHLAALDPGLIRPLSPNFQRKDPGPEALTDGKAMTPELPYEVVQLLGVSYGLPMAQVLRAAALHRLGNSAASLKALHPLQELLQQLRRYPDAVRVLLELKVLPVLRDAGDVPGALALVAGLDYEGLGPDLACRVLVAKGLLHVKRDEFNKALSAFKSAARRAEQLDRTQRRMPGAYLAMGYLALKQPKRALQILRKRPNAPPGEPFDVALQFEHTLAQAYLGTGDLDGAARVLSQVGDECDRVRARFRSWEDRMSWQTRFELIWSQLVTAHVLRGDRTAAFDCCERGRSRAVLDQLQAGHRPVPATAQPFVQAATTLKARLGLIADIDAALAAEVPLTMPYELVAELRKLDPSAEIVERLAEGGERIAPQLLRAYRQAQESRLMSLLNQIDAQRNQAFEQIIGRTTPYAELRGFLAGRKGTPHSAP